MFSIFQYLFGAKVWYYGFAGIGEKWDTASTLIFIGCILGIAAVGYLCGSVNSAIILTRFIYKENIREKGSGNPGMTNVMRSYGWLPALLTLLGDMFKCMIGMMVGTLIFGLTGAYIGGLFGIIGHICPLYYKFKGGKGVASMFMFLLYIDSVAFVVIGLLFILIVWGTKYLSLGSVMSALIMPLILYNFEIAEFHNYFGAIRLTVALIIGLTVFYKHRANITRIMNKTENKFSFKKTKKKQEVIAEHNAMQTNEDEAYGEEEELTPDVLARKEANRKKSAKKKSLYS